MTAIIRTLDDITLVPTLVTYEDGTGKKDVREEMQAELFTELKGKPVTLVLGMAMGGAPFSKTGRLARASCARGLIWLGVIEKRKRNPTSFQYNFSYRPVILLRGEHALDFRPLLPRIESSIFDSEMLVHRDSYGDTWRKVAAYCADTAGAKAVLIDTSEAAAQLHAKWLPEHRADMARRREREQQARAAR